MFFEKWESDFNLFCRYGWLKNPAIWLPEKILAHISGQKFSQIWDLCRNTAKNISFQYRTNSVKINDQIFQLIQKTLFFANFWSTFPNFGVKKKFPENPTLSRTTQYGFPAPCQNLEKTNDTIPRKRPDRHKDRRNDGGTDCRMDRPYFIGPFRLPSGVQKATDF